MPPSEDRASPPPAGNGVATAGKIKTRTHQPPATALLVYPATLIIGSLFSVLSPTAQGARDPTISSTGTTSSDPPVNYFARKNNIFNVYFVKIGWLWTTLAFATLLLTQRVYVGSGGQGPRRAVQAVIRYGLATGAWILTTQWFFGPAVIDRSFVFSGGRCERIVSLAEGGDMGEDGDGPSLQTVLTAAACKSAGGAWRGGHDVSGHVFMLVLATAMLGFEVWGCVYGDAPGEERDMDGNGNGAGWARRFVGAVVGLSWWMLLMTGIWFHTWFEKLTGLLIALGTVYTIYILPRRVIPWRNVVGVPGV